MKRIIALIPKVALVAIIFAACGETKNPAGPNNNPNPTSNCPEVIHTSPDGSKVGAEVPFLEIRNDDTLFVQELNDSTAYMWAEFFSLDGSVTSVRVEGTRVEGGVVFAGRTCERSCFNVYCIDGDLTVWSLVDSTSAKGLTDIGVWQDPATKEWAYRWLCEEPNVGPFDGCDILIGTAENVADGTWEAVSVTEGSLLRVSEDGLWIPTGTLWTAVRFFGEQGELPGVIETPIGQDGFVPRPADQRYTDLNMGYACTDTSWVWSLIVDSTPLPEGAEIVRHSNSKAAIRVTAWIRSPFDECQIVYGSAHSALDGSWMEATSTEEARMTRVTKEGVYFENGPWTEARFFGELGWLPSVIVVDLVPLGNELFADRPDDERFVQCNLDYWCAQDEELVWSLIVWSTSVPDGVSIVEHTGRGKCYQIDAWIDEPEPVDCSGGCPAIIHPPSVGPMVEDLQRDGRVVSWKGCYPQAFVQDSRGIQWGYWAEATGTSEHWELEIPEGFDLFTPACEQHVWSQVPQGGIPPEGFLIWCDEGSCAWQLDPNW